MFAQARLAASRQPTKACLRRFLATEVDASVASTSASQTRPVLNTAVILNRSPIITRTPSPFERAYYKYQANIHRALQNPFPNEFYFKQGSPLEARFNVEEQRRERAALGTPFGMQEGEKSEAVLQAEQTIRDEEDLRMPRQHEADTKNDFKDLNRRGQRNLYLALLQKEGDKHVWRFPQGPVNQGELLHHAAERDLETQCGDGMDTWIVSRKPVGVYHPPSPPATDPAKKNVVFFYKAHIMAGQVQHDPKTTLDFAWLTKGELSERVEPTYWESVKDMLSDF
ncbi:hypothetical protein CONPUDRAFT_150164 [Coniophora puteana RWD-64-598 SS2]|uniref:Large ribosomal subunit protein mL46 n=1 Tax=Coniophora puteana (strain RWD-64-598) TaxID=741705 RepID=A0A5M3N1S9_CONPW|nr:uncharacterized protein CONPUDRAFT_150164 [Coniophora puteana RWD-64-598 SS2]EIW85352.1 hypothetical protein CONPUDRAFT_150164 [Coniophora puteana RWD-64-598 SS2]